MKTYIVLLRGINVSGKNKLPMQELRKLLNELNFQEVKTYIQSGNIVLNSLENKTMITSQIKETLRKNFGYEISVIVKTIKEWETVIRDNPFKSKEEKQQYFTFLQEVPDLLEFQFQKEKDDYKIQGDVVYVYVVEGYGKTKLNNNFFEKKLKVSATTRNFKTTKKLLELAKESDTTSNIKLL